MKKTLPILAFTFLLSCAGFAPTSAHTPTGIPPQTMAYAKIGAEYLGPHNPNHRSPHAVTGGIGYRNYIYPRQGIDMTVEGSYYPEIANTYMAGANLHYIVKPFYSSKWYVGAGAMARYIDCQPLNLQGVAVGPNFLVGREFTLSSGHTSFIQLDAGTFIGKERNKMPTCKLTVGYGF